MSSIKQPTVFRAPESLLKGLIVVAVLGAIVFLMGTLLEPERVWGGYLMGFSYFVGLALAGPLFLSVLYLCDATWCRPLRRIPEAMTGALPVALLLGLGLIMGTSALYEWSHTQVVEADRLLDHKSAYLNLTGFSIRLVIYFALWIWIGRKIVARSSPSAEESPMERRRGTIAVSALFMAVLAITFSLASVDWIQSLDPHWFSTMFALRTLSGVGSSGLALCILVLVTLRRHGPLRDVVTRDVMDDLGKILLALSLFWAYIWYCEYMIIWYSNIPEETGYYLLRREGAWGTLTPVNMVVNFVVPFLCLMLRDWRRNSVVLMRIAGLVLVGRALDLLIMIVPPLSGGEVHVGLWELGPVLGALALFLWVLLRALGRSPLVAREG